MLALFYCFVIFSFINFLSCTIFFYLTYKETRLKEKKMIYYLDLNLMNKILSATAIYIHSAGPVSRD